MELVEKPGDAKLSARIRELEADWVKAREELEKAQAEHKEEIQALQRQNDNLVDVKGKLETV